MTRRTLSTMHLLALAACTAALGAAIGGCGKSDDQPKPIQRHGRVASINKETGLVEMWYYHPKQKKEIKITGTLDPKVEIFINGALASIDDVQIDDKVLVLGRPAVGGSDRQFIAIRVEVERPITETSPAASAPATKPPG